MDQEDRFALDQLKRDQEYRKRLDDERGKFWNRAAAVATVLTGLAGLASLVVVLLHLR